MVLAVLLGEFVEDYVGAVCQLLDVGVHRSVVLGVTTQGPVVLVANVGPADLVVEAVAFRLDLLLELFVSHLLIKHILNLLLLLLLFLPLLLIIQLIPGVEICSIWSLPELVQGEVTDSVDNLWSVEAFDNVSSFLGCGQVVYCVSIDFEGLCLFKVEQLRKVCLAVLIKLVVLFLLLEGS